MGQSQSNYYDWKPEYNDYRDDLFKYEKINKLPERFSLIDSFKEYNQNYNSSIDNCYSSIIISYGLKYKYINQKLPISIKNNLKNFIVDPDYILSINKMNNYKNHIKQSIIDKKPIIFGMTIYDSFKNIDNTGIFKLPEKDDIVIGGLLCSIVGYDNIQKHWIIKHHLNNNFGDHGYIYIHYDDFDQIKTELWRLMVVNHKK